METFDPQKREVWKRIKKILKKSGIAAVLLVAVPVIGFGAGSRNDNVQAKGGDRSGASF